jgi:hypothetical protein
MNWDFIVVAHETGHNFGAYHTHDYCPPIDQCAPDGYYGPCQTQQVCQVGTIMSYCHLCPGGITNSQTFFHSQIAGVMLGGISSSCATSYAPASASIREGTGVNPVLYLPLTPPELGTTWLSSVDLGPSGAPFSFVAIGSQGPVTGPVLWMGELLIDVSAPLYDLDVGIGSHWIPIPDDMSLLGETVYTQAGSFNAGLIELFNALDLYLAY